MPIIIDGWNLIRNRASNIQDEEGKSIESVRSLVAYLQEFQLTHNDPIILVFDSTFEHLDIDYKNSPKLMVVPKKNADDYIKKYIDMVSERKRRNIRVVSSDKSVYYYAKSSYATPVKCEEFWRKIRNSTKRVANKVKYFV